MEKKILKEMFDNLLHIWNKTNYWNPKMKSYIYGSTNWVHIIDLLKTAQKIEDVKSKIGDLTWEWKKVLFVATKLQGRDSFQKLAEDTGNFYVCEKWIPWLLTNFKTIKKRISTYLKLIRDSETWAFDVLTKKEKASKLLELSKLDKAFKWLKLMKKIPEVIFVVDWVYEKQAVKEANIIGLDIFAIFNSNGNPNIVTDLIPANTNAVKSIEYITSTIKGSFKIWIKPKRKAFIKRQSQSRFSWGKKAFIKKERFVKKNDDKKITLKKVEDKKVTLKKTPIKDVIIKKDEK
jgi:small subunit ribosomal protein S2